MLGDLRTLRALPSDAAPQQGWSPGHAGRTGGRVRGRTGDRTGDRGPDRRAQDRGRARGSPGHAVQLLGSWGPGSETEESV